MALTQATSTAAIETTTASHDTPTCTMATNTAAVAMKPVLNGLHALVLALSVYLLVALLVHERSRFSSISSKLASGVGQTLPRGRNNLSQNVGRWLRILCIVSAALCCCVCVIDLISFNTDIVSGWQCTVSKNIGVATLTTLDATIYLFLWLRQYLICKSLPFESRLAKHVINVLKWTTLGLICGIFGVTNSLLACCRKYVFDAEKDRCCGATSTAIRHTLFYTWSVGSLLLHCTLVLMFVCPMIRLRRKRAQQAPACATTAPQKRIKVLVRRCLAVSVACVATDVAAMLLGDHGILGSHNSQLRHLLYNANALLNTTLIVVSFPEWRPMLLIWVGTWKETAIASSQ